jgi:KDO2-lipid IV(A) lauroyltransferase
MTVVHHGLGRPGLSAWLADVRTRQGDVQLVELGSARAGELLAAVRQGRHLVAMMDQNARPDEGAFAPFFGAAACTRRGPVVLAHRLGVPLLPAFSYRLDPNSTHRVEFGKPIEVTTADRASDRVSLEGLVSTALGRVNRVIEEAIRAHPEQWIWSHRRFKTRPSEREAPGLRPGPAYPPRRSRDPRR